MSDFDPSMFDGPTPERVAAAGAEAAQSFLDQLSEDLSTGKFVMLVEAVDPQGERCMWMAVAQGQKQWDSLGLLEYARINESGVIIDEDGEL